ncbi:vacuolar protein sorting-associated protein 26B-like [Episyrphus balteatus]|uniref:vacuolar protein sorting-associated protein 26B-like n=1 Tax=Episyrphus balteatus TaxID=286459 RepID=UPI002485C0E0|nr:vacuolar protein sorting-associated protein 26B-like [Episyrphus balteatus]
MHFLGFGQSAELDIVFDGAENRKLVELKTEEGKKEKCLLYYDGEPVSGKVNVTLKKPGSRLEHQGIKIEFIGQVELFYDRGNHHEFKTIIKELARPGDLIQNTSYPFEFLNVEKPFEVYNGSNVRLRYFLRATIVRRLSDIAKEVDIAVHTLCTYPDTNIPIKMEVGIEDCLHIEFEYNKSKYHLKDVIVGKIYFLLVRIKIKHMEITIIKRESTGSGPNIFTENENIAKYEIMDGAPVKGESIPIRVFLGGYSLTPTMKDISKKFSVKYFLNLVLMDTEDRRYFKQQEIILWRKADKTRKTSHNQQLQTSNPRAPTHLYGGRNEIGGFSGPSQAEREPDAEYRPAIDPKMGLFTRESPQQEYSQLPGDEPVDMLRGTADGAASGADHLSDANATTNAPPATATNATTANLFESNDIVVAAAAAVSTTPPPLPVVVDDESNYEDVSLSADTPSAPISNPSPSQRKISTAAKVVEAESNIQKQEPSV